MSWIRTHDLNAQHKREIFSQLPTYNFKDSKFKKFRSLIYPTKRQMSDFGLSPNVNRRNVSVGREHRDDVLRRSPSQRADRATSRRSPGDAVRHQLQREHRAARIRRGNSDDQPFCDDCSRTFTLNSFYSCRFQRIQAKVKFRLVWIHVNLGAVSAFLGAGRFNCN